MGTFYWCCSLSFILKIFLQTKPKDVATQTKAVQEYVLMVKFVLPLKRVHLVHFLPFFLSFFLPSFLFFFFFLSPSIPSFPPFVHLSLLLSFLPSFLLSYLPPSLSPALPPSPSLPPSSFLSSSLPPLRPSFPSFFLFPNSSETKCLQKQTKKTKKIARNKADFNIVPFSTFNK